MAGPGACLQRAGTSGGAIHPRPQLSRRPLCLSVCPAAALTSSSRPWPSAAPSTRSPSSSAAAWAPRSLRPGASAGPGRRSLLLAPPPAAFGSGRRRSGEGSSSNGGLGDLDPVKALQKELGVQSNRLDGRVKDLVERAIGSLGYRVTVGDVAARAGVTIAQADEALKALAYDSLAALEVSKEGEVVYAFDSGFKAKIASRSWLRRLAPAWERAKGIAAYASRIAFGTALIVSVAVVWLAVLAVLSSGRDNDRRDRGYGGYGSPMNMWISPGDFFWYWQPGYSREMRSRLDSGQSMNFVEAVFSFVFGDGDPNQTWAERRWRALGAHIQRLGGVVTAEEMAPFLDPPPLGGKLRPGPAKYGDESFVLPALIRFGGEPFVAEDGGLLYRFPALQAGATELRATATTVRVPLEREYEFSEAEPGQQAGALALGVFNVIGVVILSSMLADPYAKYALFRQGLGWVLGLLPFLQAYAASFFAIPFVRSLSNARKNADIAERNEARGEAVALLQSGDKELAAKAAAARKQGQRRVIGRQDIVYTTEQETDRQANMMEEEEFDQKLGVKPQGGARRGELPERGRAAGGRRFDDVFDRRQGRGGEKEREKQRASKRDDWDSW